MPRLWGNRASPSCAVWHGLGNQSLGFGKPVSAKSSRRALFQHRSVLHQQTRARTGSSRSAAPGPASIAIRCWLSSRLRNRQQAITTTVWLKRDRFLEHRLCLALLRIDRLNVMQKQTEIRKRRTPHRFVCRRTTLAPARKATGFCGFGPASAQQRESASFLVVASHAAQVLISARPSGEDQPQHKRLSARSATDTCHRDPIPARLKLRKAAS